MMDIVARLGDDRANRRPELPGANSAYAILNHCLGVMDGWGGAISGRAVQRDREAEFGDRGAGGRRCSTGARAARRLLEHDLADIDAAAPARALADPNYATLTIGRTQGGVAVHILEELFQHLGHMELTRDLLGAAD